MASRSSGVSATGLCAKHGLYCQHPGFVELHRETTFSARGNARFPFCLCTAAHTRHDLACVHMVPSLSLITAPRPPTSMRFQVKGRSAPHTLSATGVSTAPDGLHLQRRDSQRPSMWVRLQGMRTLLQAWAEGALWSAPALRIVRPYAQDIGLLIYSSCACLLLSLHTPPVVSLHRLTEGRSGRSASMRPGTNRCVYW